MQQELTVLQQTLMVKQEEISRLIRDNERFIAESRQQAKENSHHREALERLRGDLGIANAATARAEGGKELLANQLEAKSKEAGDAQSEVAAAKLREEGLVHKLAIAEAELAALGSSSEADGSQA
ncbi:hypothetical protein [Pseudomonas fortuita]